MTLFSFFFLFNSLRNDTNNVCIFSLVFFLSFSSFFIYIHHTNTHLNKFCNTKKPFFIPSYALNLWFLLFHTSSSSELQKPKQEIIKIRLCIYFYFLSLVEINSPFQLVWLCCMEIIFDLLCRATNRG